MLKLLESHVSAFAKQHGLNANDPSVYTETKELILDGSPVKSISVEEGQQLEKFKNLVKLSLNSTGLTSLANFPKLPSLKVLELTDNYLSDPVVFSLIPDLFPELKVLQLGGNHLKNVQDVQHLAKLTNLTHLGLAFNPLENTKGYRATVFSLLPKLQLLDQADSTGVEKSVNSQDEEDEDDDDDEYDDEEDDAEEEGVSLLKKFYETEYKSDEDEDDDEFVPQETDAPDDDEEEFEDELEDEDENFQGDFATSSGKRPRDEDDESTSSGSKHS